MQEEPKNTSSIGVFTTDTELIVKVWDDAMRLITGLGADDAVGRHLTELVPDIAERGLLPRFERVKDLGTSEVLAPAFHKYLFRCPSRIPSTHFTEMRQLVKISALRKDNAIYGLLVVVEDVTERLDHEREFARMLTDPDDSVRLRAAKGISRGDDPLSPESSKAIIGALGDNNWRVRRKLVEGLSRRLAPDAVTALLEAVRNEHLDFGLLNSALQVLQATSIDTIQTLLDFLRGSDTDLRIQAALALGEQNNQLAVPELINALNDQDDNVRFHAIEALGKLKAADAVEALLSIAESKNFFLAFPALEALGKIGGAGIAERVLKLADDADISEAAVETLGAIGDISAAESIVVMLNDRRIAPTLAANALAALHDRHADGEPVAESVRRKLTAEAGREIAAALKSAPEKDLPGLILVAGWAEDDGVRQALANLLGHPNLGDQAAASLACHGEAAVDLLVEKLRSEDTGVRAAAARGLGKLDSPRGVDALISMMSSKGAPGVAAAQALAGSSDPRAFDALIGVLAADDDQLRRAATSAVRSMIRPETSSRLLALVGDPDPKIRETVVRVVGDFTTPESRSAVLAACRDEHGTVRAAAVEQLANYSDDEVLTEAKHALADEVPKVRAAAARTLGRFDGEQPVQALRVALSDTDPWTRYFAVRSLAEKEDAESYEIFKKLSTDDEAEQVRVAAAEAMARR